MVLGAPDKSGPVCLQQKLAKYRANSQHTHTHIIQMWPQIGRSAGQDSENKLLIILVICFCPIIESRNKSIIALHSCIDQAEGKHEADSVPGTRGMWEKRSCVAQRWYKHQG